MIKALLAVLLLAPAVVFAQPAGSPDGGVVSSGAQQLKAVSTDAREDVEEVRREMESKLEAAKREIREELKAQLAAQSAGQVHEEWIEEKRKLDFFVPNGYFRTRPDLFYKFDLGRGPDVMGYTLFPRSLVSPQERTTAGINMRFRFEPTINVSEEVRIKAQIDALDNILFGSNPDYAASRSDLQNFSILSNSQVAPQAGINSLQNSINAKRVYAEVTTPVGILRFGRMGFHWGLGMVHNDGNCLDCDHGDTVDRIMFVAQPTTDLYVSPMIDWNGIGPTSGRSGEVGQPFPITNSDQTLSFSIAVAKRDTEQQAKTKLLNGQAVFNYGVHLMYRTQKNDPTEYYKNISSQFSPTGLNGGQNPYVDPYNNPSANVNIYVPRRGSYYLPDLWMKYERKRFRVEIEAAALLGSFENRALNPTDAGNPQRSGILTLTQFGAVGQGEVRFFDGSLHIGLEVGYASGDNSPGFGNRPGRVVDVAHGNVLVNQAPPGAVDGPKYCISAVNPDGTPCSKSFVRNFRFNADYRIDMILWREIIGNVTGAIYAKPTVAYDITEGFKAFLSVIYSRAVFSASTPSTTNPNLGIELNVGTRYETEDGFFAQAAWGIFFPLGGLGVPPGNPNPPGLDTAQALRGMLGVRF